MFVYFYLIRHVCLCSLFELFSGSNMFALFARSFRLPLCLSQVVRCVFRAILYCCFLHLLCFPFLKFLYLSALHYRLRACSLTFVNLRLDRIIFYILACNPSYGCYIKLCFFSFYFLFVAPHCLPFLFYSFTYLPLHYAGSPAGARLFYMLYLILFAFPVPIFLLYKLFSIIALNLFLDFIIDVLSLLGLGFDCPFFFRPCNSVLKLSKVHKAAQLSH